MSFGRSVLYEKLSSDSPFCENCFSDFNNVIARRFVTLSFKY